MSCGVITSAWLWRISSFWVSAIGSGELGPFLAYLLRTTLYIPTFGEELIVSAHHVRPCSGHPRVCIHRKNQKAWITGTSPAKRRLGASHAELLAQVEAPDIGVVHDILSPALHQ